MTFTRLSTPCRESVSGRDARRSAAHIAMGLADGLFARRPSVSDSLDEAGGLLSLSSPDAANAPRRIETDRRPLGQAGPTT